MGSDQPFHGGRIAAKVFVAARTAFGLRNTLCWPLTTSQTYQVRVEAVH